MSIVCAIHPENSDFSYIIGDTRMTRNGLVIDPSMGSKDEDVKKWISLEGNYGNWAVSICGALWRLHVVRDCREDILREVKSSFDVARNIKKAMQNYREDEDGDGFDGLIVSPNGIWHMDFRYALAPVSDGEMAACGGGVDIAYGAWDVINNIPPKGYEGNLRRCVEVVVGRDIGCGGRIIMEKIVS